MGNRKPPVPRRRIGVNLVEFTTRQATRPHAQLMRIVSSATSMTVGGEQAHEDVAAGAAPDDPISLPSSPDAARSSPSSPLDSMHIQQAHKSAPMAPHMHQAPKSVVSTVPLRETPRSAGKEPAQRPSPRAAACPASGSETVTMTVAELEAWKQRTVMQIEDHFTNEQLKRIAEFGRVHANLVKEAKEYVFGIETQLKEQFQRERESLQQQAEAYVARFQQENEMLRQHVEALQEELGQLKASTGTESISSADEEQDEADSALEAELAVEAEGDDGEDGFVSTQELEIEEEPESLSVTPSSSPAVEGLDESEEREVCLDDVTETMSRSMGIQTPQHNKSRLVRTAAALDVDSLDGSPRAASTKIQAATVLDPPSQTVEAYLLSNSDFLPPF